MREDESGRPPVPHGEPGHGVIPSGMTRSRRAEPRHSERERRISQGMQRDVDSALPTDAPSPERSFADAQDDAGGGGVTRSSPRCAGGRSGVAVRSCTARLHGAPEGEFGRRHRCACWQGAFCVAPCPCLCSLASRSGCRRGLRAPRAVVSGMRCGGTRRLTSEGATPREVSPFSSAASGERIGDAGERERARKAMRLWFARVGSLLRLREIPWRFSTGEPLVAYV